MAPPHILTTVLVQKLSETILSEPFVWTRNSSGTPRKPVRWLAQLWEHGPCQWSFGPSVQRYPSRSAHCQGTISSAHQSPDIPTCSTSALRELKGRSDESRQLTTRLQASPSWCTHPEGVSGNFPGASFLSRWKHSMEILKFQMTSLTSKSFPFQMVNSSFKTWLKLNKQDYNLTQLIPSLCSWVQIMRWC